MSLHFNFQRKNGQNKTVISLTVTLEFYRNVNENEVSKMVSDFVSQRDIIKSYAPLGFATEIVAANIQITTSKLIIKVF